MRGVCLLVQLPQPGSHGVLLLQASTCSGVQKGPPGALAPSRLYRMGLHVECYLAEFPFDPQYRQFRTVPVWPLFRAARGWFDSALDTWHRSSENHYGPVVRRGRNARRCSARRRAGSWGETHPLQRSMGSGLDPYSAFRETGRGYQRITRRAALPDTLLPCPTCSRVLESFSGFFVTDG